MSETQGKSIDLAVIPGDGIGPEVTAQAVKALKAAIEKSDIDLSITEYDFGAERYNRTGEILSDEELENLKKHDAILLGAVGDPSVTSGILERGLLLKMRFGLDHYINLRPSRSFPGIPTPLAKEHAANFVVVREGTEGLYRGDGTIENEGSDDEVATEFSVNTARGVERVVRYAFDVAQSREAKKLTWVHKTNVLTRAGKLWGRMVEKVGAENPEIAVDYMHIDAATIYMVTDPERFDVILTDNLFGDILTDEASAITGGIGLAASGNINPERTTPSMFEPIHGSAPDIAGTGQADPIAAIGSAALMLDFLGFKDEAKLIEDAIVDDMRNRAIALETGVRYVRNTDQIGDAIVAEIHEPARHKD